VKHPTQGSSIGVQIVKQVEQLPQALRQAAFLHTLEPEPDTERRLNALRLLADPRTGIGLPAWVTQPGQARQLVHGPDELDKLWASATGPLHLQAVDSPAELLVEDFIRGTEFSVIVLEDTHGRPLALPPTEILKLDELFDYRAKYLPGIARKRTPIELPEAAIRDICQQAERLKEAFFFDVYARLDGILAQDGTVYFNDPNTTSGMLPSSFFFHQAAEIGLSPTGLLTYIIETSLRKARIHRPGQYAAGLTSEAVPASGQASTRERLRVGVLLGGYSTERHISAESGRNIYEKLSASTDFRPLPVFVLHNRYLPQPLRSRLDAEAPFSLWQIPIRMLLKDNADDIAKLIAQSVTQPLGHPVVVEIRERAAEIRSRFGLEEVPQPLHLPFAGLGHQLDFAFIALHGRPGEDGQLQTLLEAAGVPYNGSGVPSSQITIDKYRTNELLQAAGLNIPKHYLVDRQRYATQPEAELDAVERMAPYPLIAKPFDEGCSSAVLKIRNREQLKTYLQAAFRAEEILSESLQAALHLRPTDPFPAKDQVLVEELVQAHEGQRLMEITVGLVTRLDAAGKLTREIFEPSETPSQAEVLTLEEKFLAGEGQNITPARFNADSGLQTHISQQVRATIARAAEVLNIEGYCRIDAFVRLGPAPEAVEVVFIEVNSLPGMTPATCIFHQTALAHMTPLDFIRQIIHFGMQRAGKVPR
jgi:D-alanine-D-alanine ligase